MNLGPFRERAWRTVGLLWFAFAINYIDRQIVFVIYPALRREVGFSETELGLAGAIFLWVYAASMPLAGAAADRFSRSRMIVSSVILWSAATIGSGLSGSVVSFLTWRGVTGLTEALYFPAAVALIRELHMRATRSRALSLHATAQLAGITAGGWYGAWTAEYVGWRTGFVVIGCVGVLYAAVLASALPGPRNVPELTSVTGLARMNRFTMLRSWSYWSLATTFFAFCATLWLFYAWFPETLYTRHRLSLTRSGVFGTAFLQASSVIGILAGGFLADRWSQAVPPSRFYLCAAGTILSAPFAYEAFAAETLFAAVSSSAAFGFFGGWMAANVFAAAYDVVPAQGSGFAAGILNTAGGIAGAAMIFIAGFAKSSIGFAGLMKWSVAAMSALSFLLIVCAKRRFAVEHAATAEQEQPI